MWFVYALTIEPDRPAFFNPIYRKNCTLTSHFQGLIDNNQIIQRSNSCELYFEHDELEPLVKELKKLDLEFIHEIGEQPWKQQVIRFYDFDKNLIEIGERMEHVAFRLSNGALSLEEISKITYLEPNVVKSAIQEYEA